MTVSALQKTQKPLQSINHIKRDKQQFALLGGVNSFMVYDIAVNPGNVTRPVSAKNVDTIIFRDKTAFHFHSQIIF